MNKVMLIGRLTADPEFRFNATTNGCVARFTLAVDRRGREGGTDFIPCVCFNKVAEWMDKYCQKGTKLAMEGRLSIDKYKDKEGKTRETTTVIINEYPEFCESRKSQSEPPASGDGFMNVEPNEELPFK